MGIVKSIPTPPPHYKGTLAEWKDLTPRKQYNITHAVRIATQAKGWRDSNKEQANAATRVWRAANKETAVYKKKNNARAKQHYEDNKEQKLEAARSYYQANKDKVKAYQEKNHDKIQAYLEENRESRAVKNKERDIKKEREFYQMFGEDGIIP